MFGAAAAGLATAANVGSPFAWGLIAAVMAATATIVDAYRQLIGFERNAKVYRDALAALDSLHRDAPWLVDDAAAPPIGEFVSEAEAIFQREISQWGQLAPSPRRPKSPSHRKTRAPWWCLDWERGQGGAQVSRTGCRSRRSRRSPSCAIPGFPPSVAAVGTPQRESSRCCHVTTAWGPRTPGTASPPQDGRWLPERLPTSSPFQLWSTPSTAPTSR